MVIPVDPRPLNQGERNVLGKILAVEFTGHEELLAQLDAAKVVAVWSDESMSVDVQVSEVEKKPELSGPIPVRAVVESESETLLVN